MSRDLPLGPRLVAAAGALGVGLYFGAAAPGALLARGYPFTAAALMACALPLVAFLALLALFPDVLQGLLRRWTRLDLRDGGHGAVAIVMALTLFFVLGYGSIVNGVYAYEHDVLRAEPSSPITGDGLFVGVLLNVAVLVLPPLLYVSFVGERGGVHAFRALGLRSEGAARALVIGAASAIAVIFAIGALVTLVEGRNVQIPENERALEIARSVTLLGAFGLAIGSSVSEEIFFRGFLQPRIGLFGQAVLFMLAHLSYLNVLELAVTFVLALAFGAIYRATGNLLAPIAGHFTFNLLMLLIGIYGPEAT